MAVDAPPWSHVGTNVTVGETSNFVGLNERKHLVVVRTLCALLEELAPQKPQGVVNYHDLIPFVDDRPGHDLRYAIDASNSARELGLTPPETFGTGIRKTLPVYPPHDAWVQTGPDRPF